MREHIYRAKRIYNNEWAYGNLVVDKNGEPHIVEFESVEEDGHHVVIDGDTPMFVIPETVGEYTGLTDKNGKKIFEGDIIQVTTKDTSKLRTANIGFGTFADENSAEEEPYIGFYIEFDEIKTTIGQLIEYQNDIEAIGTIFDEGGFIDTEYGMCESDYCPNCGAKMDGERRNDDAET